MFQVGQVRPAPAVGGTAIWLFFSRAVGLIELGDWPPVPAIVRDRRDLSLAQT